MDTSRWTGWRGWRTWLVGGVAFHVYMLMPWQIARHCNFLLPYVGDYVYFEDALSAID